MKRFSQDMYARENAVTSISSLTGNKPWHFLLVTLVSLMMFTAFGILSGCSGGGGGGGGSSTTTTTTDDTTTYTGSAKVSGTIKLSYLSSSDQSQIDTSDTTTARMIRPRTSKAVNTETEAVKLYVVGPNGGMVDTGITCDIDEDAEGDRTYDCDGVRDGVNYIVRYVQINPDTDKALELTTNAYVPAGDTAQSGSGDVTPQTSVVVKALVDAILSATKGTDIEEEVVNTIISSVKTAIETLVTSGAIQIPSMVVDVDDGTTLDDLVGEEETDNEKLDNTSGLILADTSVDSELGLIASSTQAEKFDLASIDTAEEKEALIRKVFKDLLTEDSGEEEEMPTFFYNFFIWHYVNNQTITAGDLLGSLVGGMDYFCSDNDSACIEGTTDPLVYYSTAISQISVANALTLFNSEMTQLYALLAKDPTTLTADEKEALAQFPPVVRGLFPSTMGAIESTTSLVTPQGIALVIFFEDVFMSSGDYLGAFASDDDWWEWDDGALFEVLGMETYVSTHQDEFTGVEIFGLYLHPGSVWIEGNASNNYQGYELEALMGGTDLMDLSQFVSGGEPDITSGVDVTLTYPKNDATTGSIDLVYITHDGDPYGYWGIDPWGESQMDPACTSQDYTCMQDYIAANPDRIVSDFTGGSYTITVKEAGTTTVLATKTFTKKVITGMLNTYVKLLSPAGQPNYPGDNATQEELDAYQDAWDLFYTSVGYTTFAATLDSTGTAVDTGATHAKVTVSWQPPSIVLPEGVKMFYDIQVGVNDCDSTGGNCQWNDIWNTWEADKRVYTTSFTIPELLPKLADPYDQYNLNVGVNFVDSETGEYLGRGGSAYTQFYVGDPIDKTATFDITGSFTIADGTLNSNNNAMTFSDLRVALIKETQDGSTFTQTVVAISDLTTTGTGKGTYTLSPTIGDYLDNAGMNTWFNLIMVEDPSDALAADSPLGNTTMMYWPDYSSGGIWFDTWGGMLRVYKDTCTTDGTCYSEEKIIVGGEEVTGPKFSIGSNTYTAPDPMDVTPVSASDLATDFTITGTVDTANVTTPVVAMIKGAYNSSVGYWTETVLSIGTITSGTYSVTVSVGDFYDADGYPIDAYFDMVLIDDATDPTYQVAEGKSINYQYVMVYWPDYSSTSFWFDTWRGAELYVVKEIYNTSDSSWTHTEYDVPTTYTSVPGPDLMGY